MSQATNLNTASTFFECFETSIFSQTIVSSKDLFLVKHKFFEFYRCHISMKTTDLV